MNAIHTLRLSWISDMLDEVDKRKAARTTEQRCEHWMKKDRTFWWRLMLFSCGIASMALFADGCRSKDKLPDTSSKTYADFVSAFYTGLGALQVGDDVRAERELSRAAEVVPGEPAAWANWGVLGLRQRDFDTAARRIERARALAPQNDQICYLAGLLEAGRGRIAAAIADFRKAVEINPKNLIAKYRLAEEIERQGGPDSDGEFQRLIEQILQVEPNNLAALLELSRITAKRGEVAALKDAIARIQSQSSGWPVEVQKQLGALVAASSSADQRSAAVRTIFLRNTLMMVPGFRANLAAIKPPPGDEAQPFTHFLSLPTPVFTPAPADTAMTFRTEPLTNADKKKWNWIGAISLSGVGAPVVAEANGGTVHLSSGVDLPFPGGTSNIPPSPEGIVPIDFNYDFKTDLVFAGAGGVRFYRQESSTAFTDVTARTKLSKAVLGGNYTGGWAVDIEADGDLDLVLASEAGAPTVLRNNGDDTFTPISPFTGISGARGFVWVDLDGDGNPDAAFIDGTNHLRVFHNDRSGRFTEISSPAEAGLVKTIAAGDVSHRGVLDLLAVRNDGAILRLVLKDGGLWNVGEIARVADAPNYLAGDVRLHAADLDNNGAVDLLLGRVAPVAGSNSPGALLWLGDTAGNFIPLPAAGGPAMVFDTADLNADGRLDLLGISNDGQSLEAVNHGSKNYHWQIIRPRANQAVGDQRINPFGVGGEIEIRSGLMVQMQPITGPQIHFGLGDRTSVDVARILWPNGTVRAEFALKADQEIVTEQRLKGSCPFLFAYNGNRMEFVKDAVPWGSAIGLRIDNLGTASIAATEEWYKIAGDQLMPRDGFYDLRITGELWETYYYDSLALMVVDHPAGTEIFTDERFKVPAAKPAIVPTGTTHKIVSAVDDTGQNVTDIVRDLDGRYLDSFGRGQYQGVTRDHYVEVDLGEESHGNGQLYLIAKGWLHPSDSSINVAISQGQHEQAKALSFEVPDGHGGWVVAQRNLGFPAGRKKICVFDISNVFRPGTPHKLRLRTNLEVYWDSIEWAEGLPQTPLKITRLTPAVADLHYRGYSVVHQQNSSSPEIPDYNHLAGTKQPWRDLEGYYTRYGDVRELLAEVDDRYVIMNAGDEISFRFQAPAKPQAGWIRDYIIAGDGWIKDGDYNSTFSRTVLPLPYHARRNYDLEPRNLEDDWVYRHHSRDWQTYQTRYVTADVMLDALRNETGK